MFMYTQIAIETAVNVICVLKLLKINSVSIAFCRQVTEFIRGTLLF